MRRSVLRPTFDESRSSISLTQDVEAMQRCLNQFNVNAKSLSGKLTEAKQSNEQLRGKLRKTESDLTESKTECGKLDAENNSLRSRLHETEGSLASLKEQSKRDNSEVSKLRDELTAQSKKMQEMEVRHKDLLENYMGFMDIYKSSPPNDDSTMSALSSAKSVSAPKTSDSNSALKPTQEQLQQSKAEITTLRAELLAQIEMMKEMQRSHSELVESILDSKHISEISPANDDATMSALSSAMSASDSVSKTSDSASKKRKLSEERSTDEPVTVLSATAAQTLKGIVTLGPKPYWKLLEWRRVAALFTGGVPFVSDGVARLIQESRRLSMERIQDTSDLTVEIMLSVGIKTRKARSALAEAIKMSIAKNGFWRPKPKVHASADRWENLIGTTVTVQTITDELKPRRSAQIGKKGVFAAKNLAKGKVLTEHFGMTYRRKEYETVFFETRAETRREMHLFTHVFGTEELITDALAFSEPFDGFSDLFPNSPTFACDECVCIHINDFRKDPLKITFADNKCCNCEFVRAKVNGWTRVFLVCTKEIKRNTQLLADFGRALRTCELRHELHQRKCQLNCALWQELVE